MHPLDAGKQPSSPTFVPLANGARAVVRSPDGTQLWLSLENDTVLTASVTTGDLVDTLTVRAGTFGIAVTPDGRYLIGGDPAGIAVYDPQTKQMVATSPSDAGGTPTTLAVVMR